MNERLLDMTPHVMFDVSVLLKNIIQTTSNFKNSIRVMVFNAIFNNISAISWWSVLLMEKTGVPEENHRPVVSH